MTDLVGNPEDWFSHNEAHFKAPDIVLSDQAHSWRDLYNLATTYRRLVDPDQPVFWLDMLPDHKHKDGYKTDITLVQ